MSDSNSIAGTLADLLAARSNEMTNRTAITAPAGESVGYGELAAVAREFREIYRTCGIGHEDRVVLVLPDSTAAMMATLATIANAVCVPINPALREPELRALFARIRPRAVVTSSLDIPASRVAADLGATVFLLDNAYAADVPRLRVDSSTGRPVSDQQPGTDDLALILATSGTTAAAKLVPLTHRNVLAAAGATVRAYELGAADRRLHFMPLFHVQGIVGSVVASLLAAGEVVCATAFTADRLTGLVDRFGVTWYSATPAMHRGILAAGQDLRAMAASGLRFVRVGSAALPLPLRHQLEAALDVPVIESYGMTEAHQIASTSLRAEERRPGTIGRPTGATVAIMDPATGELCEPGQVGEVVIRGETVMRGYLDDDNTAVFTDGWLRTGDLGSLDGDGYLALRGRLKEIINRGGEKISPRQVDEVLETHPAVAEAVTFPVAHSRLGEEVGAAIVLRPGHDADEAGLRRFVAARLAPFKAPRHFAFVSRIPTPTTGRKMNRSELAELLDLAPATTGRGQPLAAVELAVAAIWCEVLNLPAVEADDDFFFLGGDSLTGDEVLAMVRQAFQVELSPFAMYDTANTVKGMARLIESTRENRDA